MKKYLLTVMTFFIFCSISLYSLAPKSDIQNKQNNLQNILEESSKEDLFGDIAHRCQELLTASSEALLEALSQEVYQDLEKEKNRLDAILKLILMAQSVVEFSKKQHFVDFGDIQEVVSYLNRVVTHLETDLTNPLESEELAVLSRNFVIQPSLMKLVSFCKVQIERKNASRSIKPLCRLIFNLIYQTQVFQEQGRREIMPEIVLIECIEKGVNQWNSDLGEIIVQKQNLQKGFQSRRQWLLSYQDILLQIQHENSVEITILQTEIQQVQQKIALEEQKERADKESEKLKTYQKKVNSLKDKIINLSSSNENISHKDANSVYKSLIGDIDPNVKENMKLIGVWSLVEEYEKTLDRKPGFWEREIDKEIIQLKINMLTPIIQFFHLVLVPITVSDQLEEQRRQYVQILNEKEVIWEILFQKYLAGKNIEEKAVPLLNVDQLVNGKEEESYLCLVEGRFEVKTNLCSVYKQFDNEVKKRAKEMKLSAEKWLNKYNEGEKLSCQLLLKMSEEQMETLLSSHHYQSEYLLEKMSLVVSRINPSLKSQMVHYYPYLQIEIDWERGDQFFYKEKKCLTNESIGKKVLARMERDMMEICFKEEKMSCLGWAYPILLGENKVPLEEFPEELISFTNRWVVQTQEWIDNWILSPSKWVKTESEEQVEEELKKVLEFQDELDNVQKRMSKKEEKVNQQMTQFKMQIERWKELLSWVSWINEEWKLGQNKEKWQDCLTLAYTRYFRQEADRVKRWKGRFEKGLNCEYQDQLTIIEEEHQQKIESLTELLTINQVSQIKREYNKVTGKNYALDFEEMEHFLETTDEELKDIISKGLKSGASLIEQRVYDFIKFYRVLNRLDKQTTIYRLDEESIQYLGEKESYLNILKENLRYYLGQKGEEIGRKVQRKVNEKYQKIVQWESCLRKINKIMIDNERMGYRYTVDLTEETMQLQIESKNVAYKCMIWSEEQFVKWCSESPEDRQLMSVIHRKHCDVSEEAVQVLKKSGVNPFEVWLYRLIEQIGKMNQKEYPNQREVIWNKDSVKVMKDCFNELNKIKEEWSDVHKKNLLKYADGQKVCQILENEIEIWRSVACAIASLQVNYSSKGTFILGWNGRAKQYYAKEDISPEEQHEQLKQRLQGYTRELNMTAKDITGQYDPRYQGGATLGRHASSFQSSTTQGGLVNQQGLTLSPSHRDVPQRVKDYLARDIDVIPGIQDENWLKLYSLKTDYKESHKGLKEVDFILIFERFVRQGMINNEALKLLQAHPLFWERAKLEMAKKACLVGPVETATQLTPRQAGCIQWPAMEIKLIKENCPNMELFTSIEGLMKVRKEHDNRLNILKEHPACPPTWKAGLLDRLSDNQLVLIQGLQTHLLQRACYRRNYFPVFLNKEGKNNQEVAYNEVKQNQSGTFEIKTWINKIKERDELLFGGRQDLIDMFYEIVKQNEKVQIELKKLEQTAGLKRYSSELSLWTELEIKPFALALVLCSEQENQGEKVEKVWTVLKEQVQQQNGAKEWIDSVEQAKKNYEHNPNSRQPFLILKTMHSDSKDREGVNEVIYHFIHNQRLHKSYLNYEVYA